MVSQVYHPNIDLEGNVCLNILREDWKPVLSINSVIYGLQYLFLVRIAVWLMMCIVILPSRVESSVLINGSMQQPAHACSFEHSCKSMQVCRCLCSLMLVMQSKQNGLQQALLHTPSLEQSCTAYAWQHQLLMSAGYTHLPAICMCRLPACHNCLQDPNPEDPLNKEAAQMMQDNLRQFESYVASSLTRGCSIQGSYFPPCR